MIRVTIEAELGREVLSWAMPRAVFEDAPALKALFEVKLRELDELNAEQAL